MTWAKISQMTTIISAIITYMLSNMPMTKNTIAVVLSTLLASSTVQQLQEHVRPRDDGRSRDRWKQLPVELKIKPTL